MNNNTILFVILILILVALAGMAIWINGLAKKVDRLEESLNGVVKGENEMWGIQINEVNKHLAKGYCESAEDIILIKRLLEPLIGVGLTGDKAETTDGRLEIVREVNTVGPRWMQMIEDIRIHVDKKASATDVAKLQAAFQQMLMNEKMREKEVSDERPEDLK